MTHYTNTGNPIDFPKKKDIPMLEKFAAQSLIEHDGELIFSKEKFAELIVRECMSLCEDVKFQHSQYRKEETDFGMKNIYAEGEATCDLLQNKMKEHFGVEE